jgi:hypothetical protein
MKKMLFNSSSEPIDRNLTCIKAKFLSRSFWHLERRTYFANIISFFGIKWVVLDWRRWK